MYLGISSSLEHRSPEEWAAKHKALGLDTVNFPCCDDGEDVYMAYKKAADQVGLTIAEVGVWRNTLAADPDERKHWIDYAVRQLRMADAIGADCCVNVVGTPYGPRWDGGYRENFSRELWNMAVSMIQQIIDTAQPTHTKFCIESMPWMIPSSPDEYLRLIEDVDREMFGWYHRELSPEGHPVEARIHLPATGMRLWRGHLEPGAIRPISHRRESPHAHDHRAPHHR